MNDEAVNPLLIPPFSTFDAPGQIGVGSAPALANGISFTVIVNVPISLVQPSAEVSVMVNV